MMGEAREGEARGRRREDKEEVRGECREFGRDKEKK